METELIEVIAKYQLPAVITELVLKDIMGQVSKSVAESLNKNRQPFNNNRRW
jgi:hypothetical protein